MCVTCCKHILTVCVHCPQELAAGVGTPPGSPGIWKGRYTYAPPVPVSAEIQGAGSDPDDAELQRVASSAERIKKDMLRRSFGNSPPASPVGLSSGSGRSLSAGSLGSDPPLSDIDALTV